MFWGSHIAINWSSEDKNKKRDKKIESYEIILIDEEKCYNIIYKPLKWIKYVNSEIGSQKTRQFSSF